MKGTGQFRFQGDNQWHVDISGIMSMSFSDLPASFQHKCTFLLGCDGDREWCYIKNDKDKEPYYQERDLKSIRKKNLKFLDPFFCADVAKGKLAENFQKREIKYLGETAFEGKTLHLFGFSMSNKDSRSKSNSQFEIAVDAETLLPVYSRVVTFSQFGVSNSCYRFGIKSTNKTFAAADFQQTIDKDAKPKIMGTPAEGYEYFFVTIVDGAGGRMTVRGNGQSGEKGTSSSGVN